MTLSTLYALGSMVGFGVGRFQVYGVNFWVHGRDWEVKWNVRCKKQRKLDYMAYTGFVGVNKAYPKP